MKIAIIIIVLICIVVYYIVFISKYQREKDRKFLKKLRSEKDLITVHVSILTETINKENLIIVLLNDTSYTWSEAVANGFILDFVYGWNVFSQSYTVVNELKPGEAYWLYAYHSCRLLRPIS